MLHLGCLTRSWIQLWVFQCIRQNLKLKSWKNPFLQSFSWEITAIFQCFKIFSKVPFSVLLWTILTTKLLTFHKKKKLAILISYNSVQFNWKLYSKLPFATANVRLGHISSWYIFFTFNHNDKESFHCHITTRHFPIKESYILFKGVWGLSPLP